MVVLLVQSLLDDIYCRDVPIGTHSLAEAQSCAIHHQGQVTVRVADVEPLIAALAVHAVIVNVLLPEVVLTPPLGIVPPELV